LIFMRLPVKQRRRLMPGWRARPDAVTHQSPSHSSRGHL
jgi:hypothetical protein